MDASSIRPPRRRHAALLVSGLVAMTIASEASAFLVVPSSSRHAAARAAFLVVPSSSRHASPQPSSPPRPRTAHVLRALDSTAAPPPPSLTPVDPTTFESTGFFCPFQTFGVQAFAPPPADKPLLLYLPGLDGSGLTAFVQYPALAEAYELRCLTIPTSDRSSFLDLINLVRAELRAYKSRDIFLMGESFGGLLALGTALETTNRPDHEPGKEAKVHGIVLVNPATSFSRTIWGKVGPLITKLPQPFYTLSLIPIGLLLIDGGQIQGLLKDALDRLKEDGPPLPGRPARSAADDAQEQRTRMMALGLSTFQVEFFSAALPMLLERLDLLPAPCLDWRLSQWLSAGSDMVEPQLRRIKPPVLVVAGTVDRLLPSFEEAKRLQKELPDCRVHYVQGAGHGGSLDQRINLVDILAEWQQQQQSKQQQKGVVARG